MSKYDWKAIERGYRAGQFSIRHLAVKLEVPESIARSKARAICWQWDNTDEV